MHCCQRRLHAAPCATTLCGKESVAPPSPYLQTVYTVGCAVIKTQHYLTLDSDVFATRPIKLQDLVRWPRSPEAQARVQEDAKNHRRSWWTAVSLILTPRSATSRHEREALQHCLPGGAAAIPPIGVTPAVLDAGIARNLLQR